MRTYLDLLLFLAVTLVTTVLVTTLPEWQSPVRVALGLIVVLTAPGYALTSALFARTDDIDGVERLALTLGLSIATVSIAWLMEAMGPDAPSRSVTTGKPSPIVLRRRSTVDSPLGTHGQLF